MTHTLLIFCFVVFTLENEVDGEALSTLISLIPGPDCLKDLVPKIGIRIKLHQRIKAIFNKELSMVRVGIHEITYAMKFLCLLRTF